MDSQFVSRGGTKLKAALDNFKVGAQEKTVLDVGSSTGGFVDCLLQAGAMKVYSVDTAYGELAWTLRNDPRVIVMERQNILRLESLPEKIDLVTIDVTFTALEKILPKIKNFLKPGGEVVALLKPQYENQSLTLKNGGVLPDKFHQEIIEYVKIKAEEVGFKWIGIIDSPILGGSGNKEYLVYLTQRSE